ncbi:MAG: hypothetical protein HY429_00215 [Candidatus Levybacteria bacterium]|nr:hypothetical protein [Candidatus Levybacteria bacterium]
MTPLKDQAIQTALTGNWNSAILLNRQLLKENPSDIEALNRLAFAFTVCGKIKEAKSTYIKVLKLDSQNPIALKNLKRLSSVPKANGYRQAFHIVNTKDTLFLEESGKTKIVELVNIAEPKIISTLMAAEPLYLRIKRLRIFVCDEKGLYVGMFPDDIGKRLIKFINGGNDYEAYIKSVEHRRVVIFIREIKRSARFKNQPSFVSGEKVKHTMPKNFYNGESDSAGEEVLEAE